MLTALQHVEHYNPTPNQQTQTQYIPSIHPFRSFIYLILPFSFIYFFVQHFLSPSSIYLLLSFDYPHSFAQKGKFSAVSKKRVKNSPSLQQSRQLLSTQPQSHFEDQNKTPSKSPTLSLLPL